MQFTESTSTIVYDYFEVMWFPPDGRDVLNLQGHDATISAKLLDDGSGIVVSEPLLPTYLLQNITDMHQMDPFPTEKKIDYLGKIKKYKELPDQQRQTTIYFPDGITGTTDYIGADPESTNRRTDLLLFSNLFQCPVKSVTDDDDGDILCYYGYWKIGVKGTTKKKSWKRDIDIDSAASKMKKLNISKKKEKGATESKNDDDMTDY